MGLSDHNTRTGRLALVRELLPKMIPRRIIVDRLVKKYDVALRTAYKDVADVEKASVEFYDRIDKRARHVQLEEAHCLLYERCFEDGDWNAATKQLIQLAKIYGLRLDSVDENKGAVTVVFRRPDEDPGETGDDLGVDE